VPASESRTIPTSMNAPEEQSTDATDLTQEKYRRRHSLSGIIGCCMAGLGLLFGIIGMVAHGVGGAVALPVIAITWPAMFSFCFIGLGLSIHGVIPRRRKKLFPLLGLLANPLILVLFLIYFWWPNADTLVHAAAAHDTTTVNRALLFGVKIDEPSRLDTDTLKAGTTALTAASQMGHLTMVTHLIGRGASIDQPDERGMTALHYAVISSQSQVVDYLLRCKADPNLAGPEGYPVTVAARQGHQVILELLLSHGAKVNLPGQSPLHEAAGQGHNGIASLLIKSGADVNQQDDKGRTPLHYAAQNGHIHLLRLLIRSGANVNATDRHEVTPLELALEMDHPNIVNELFASNARVDIFTAIVMNNEQKVRQIIRDRPKAVARRHKGRTPLHEAVRLGQRDVVTWLLDAGAEVDAMTEDARRQTPLHLAVMDGHLPIARLLIDRGANVNAIARPESIIAPPLYFAVQRSDTRMATLLLENGADVNAMCETLEAIARPIYFAVLRNDPAMIQTLLRYKADIDGRKNNVSPSPLYEAVRLGYIDLVALLVNSGANVQLPVGEMTPISLAESRRNRDPLVYDRILGLLSGEVKAVVAPLELPGTDE